MNTTTNTWGTAKTHGLAEGDQFLYLGSDRKAPGEGVVLTWKPGPGWNTAVDASGKVRFGGGVATRFWAAPVAKKAPAKKVAAAKEEAPAKVTAEAPAPAAKKGPAKARGVEAMDSIRKTTEGVFGKLARSAAAKEPKMAHVRVVETGAPARGLAAVGEAVAAGLGAVWFRTSGANGKTMDVALYFIGAEADVKIAHEVYLAARDAVLAERDAWWASDATKEARKAMSANEQFLAKRGYLSEAAKTVQVRLTGLRNTAEKEAPIRQALRARQEAAAAFDQAEGRAIVKGYAVTKAAPKKAPAKKEAPAPAKATKAAPAKKATPAKTTTRRAATKK